MTTSETGHTPGPWHIGQEQNYSVDRFKRNAEWARIRNAENGLVATVESVHPKGKRQSKDFDIEAANAALIAAAPDLLAALRALVAHDAAEDERADLSPSIELQQARTAIARATGGKEA